MKEVIQVIPRNDFKVYVYFNDGKIKLFDMSPLIGLGVFKQISNIDIFIKACTVLNHTLAWDLLGNRDTYNCLDIDPETIYIEGIDVKDPISAKSMKKVSCRLYYFLRLFTKT